MHEALIAYFDGENAALLLAFDIVAERRGSVYLRALKARGTENGGRT